MEFARSNPEKIANNMPFVETTAINPSGFSLAKLEDLFPDIARCTMQRWLLQHSGVYGSIATVGEGVGDIVEQEVPRDDQQDVRAMIIETLKHLNEQLAAWLARENAKRWAP